MDPITASTSRVNVPKLDDASSYLPWHRCIANALQVSDLLKYVDGTAVRLIVRRYKDTPVDPAIAARTHADEITCLVERLALDPAEADYIRFDQFQALCAQSAEKVKQTAVSNPATPDEIKADEEAVRRFDIGQSLAFGIIAG